MSRVNAAKGIAAQAERKRKVRLSRLSSMAYQSELRTRCLVTFDLVCLLLGRCTCSLDPQAQNVPGARAEDGRSGLQQ